MKLIGFYDYTVILTYMSLVSAVTGMILAGKSRFTAAVICLVVCGICDAFDGTVARSKKNRTDDEKAFGIQIDSLCDAVGFGIFPGLLYYHLAVRRVEGMVILCLYSLCAVIRLGFFNVQEGKRQQIEGGCNKTYRGLPVTTSSIILPLVYLTRSFLPGKVFRMLLHLVMAVTGFLFVLDFSVRKPDFSKILTRSR